MIPNGNFDMEKYEIKVIKSANKSQGHSYEQKQMSHAELEPKNKKRYQQPAAVQRAIYKKPAPTESGLVSRLFKNLFGKDEKKIAPKKKHNHSNKKQGSNRHPSSRSRNMQNRRRKHSNNRPKSQTEQ